MNDNDEHEAEPGSSRERASDRADANHRTLLAGSLELLGAWNSFLDRPMSREQVERLYADRPDVLCLDVASAARWAGQRLARLDARVHELGRELASANSDLAAAERRRLDDPAVRRQIDAFADNLAEAASGLIEAWRASAPDDTVRCAGDAGGPAARILFAASWATRRIAELEGRMRQASAHATRLLSALGGG